MFAIQYAFQFLMIGVDRCGSLWIVVGRCGSLWIVVGHCGSLWIVPGFSNYELCMCFTLFSIISWISTAPLQCETLLRDISYKTKLFPFLFLNLDKVLKN